MRCVDLYRTFFDVIFIYVGRTFAAEVYENRPPMDANISAAYVRHYVHHEPDLARLCASPRTMRRMRRLSIKPLLISGDALSSSPRRKQKKRRVSKPKKRADGSIESEPNIASRSTSRIARVGRRLCSQASRTSDNAMCECVTRN